MSGFVAYRNPIAGSMSLTLEIPIEDGELVLAALDKVLATADTAPDSSVSYRVRQADAMVELCKRALARGFSFSSDEADRDVGDDGQSLRGGVAGKESSSSTLSDTPDT